MQTSIGGTLPVLVPGLAVNRVCGSGALTILSVALHMAAGDRDAKIADSIEDTDLAPFVGRPDANPADCSPQTDILPITVYYSVPP